LIYFSIRVVRANTKEEAIKKIENGDFEDRHPLCDKVLSGTKLLKEKVNEMNAV